jgi:hypothetical protein
MLDPRFVWLGAAVNLAAGALAVVAIVQGKARPNRVTWLVWAIAGWIAFSAQFLQGVLLPAVLTAVVASIPTAILITSLLTGRGTWWESRVDQACLGLTLALVPLWLTLGSGDLGIALSITVHALAAVPTVAKVWRDPGSEPGVPYTAGMFNAVVTLLTLPMLTFATAGFALYFLTLCSVLAFLILVVPRLRHAQRGTKGEGEGEGEGGLLDPGDAVAFAGAFAADYLSWDEDDPIRRGEALATYWPGPGPAVAADLAWRGWDGRGRQVVNLILGGGCTMSQTGMATVHVRARIAVMGRRAPLGAAPHPTTNGAPRVHHDAAAAADDAVLAGGGDGALGAMPMTVTANAPTLTSPDWELTDNRWCHVAIEVATTAQGLTVVDVVGAEPVAPFPAEGQTCQHELATTS